MTNLKQTAALAVFAALAVSAPAQAVTNFATFSPLAADGQAANYANIRWSNNGNGSNGTGGSLNSTAISSSAPNIGSRAISFSFLVPSLSSIVNDATAIYTWTAATPTVQLATRSGSTVSQDGISGTFSFISTSAITVNTTVYAAGSNLLSGTFGNSVITGQQFGSDATYSVDSSVLGQSLTFTSDFLDLSGVTTSAFALDLANLRSTLSALQTSLPPETALRTFRASASGAFGADGDIIVRGIPEPQTWGLMVVGFGMVGLQIRRRSRRQAVAA